MNKIIKSWQEEKSVRFTNLSLAFGIALIILSISGFYIGFHNVDISWNTLKLCYMEGLDYDKYVDMYNLKGDTMNYDRGYILGMDYMRYSFYCMLIGAMLLAYSLTIYPLIVKGELKKK